MMPSTKLMGRDGEASKSNSERDGNRHEQPSGTNGRLVNPVVGTGTARLKKKSVWCAEAQW
jgi:hypothetical protein